MCDKTQRSARYTWLGDYPFLGRGVHLKNTEFMKEEIQKAIDLLLANGYEITPPQTIGEICNDFEQWWNLYNKKRGKDKCQKRWARMTKKERQACIAATPAYVRSITDKQFQKDPFTYLNGRCWQDEIIDPYGNTEQRTAVEFATKAAAILNAD